MRLRQIDVQRLQRVALPDLNEVDQACGGQMVARTRDLGRLELAGDEAAATIVPQGRGEMERRDAERSPEFDDGAGA